MPMVIPLRRRNEYQIVDMRSRQGRLSLWDGEDQQNDRVVRLGDRLKVLDSLRTRMRTRGSRSARFSEFGDDTRVTQNQLKHIHATNRSV